jgi:hypothetical protein
LDHSVHDVLERNNVNKFHVTVKPDWLVKRDRDVLEAGPSQKLREPWTNVWIAAASSDDCAIEFVIPPKRVVLRKRETAIVVYVFEHHDAAPTNPAVKTLDGSFRIGQVR